MVFGLVSRLARVRVTAGYAAILTCVAVALLISGPQAREWVISHASTNLHNLGHGYVGTLFGSAFIADAGPIYVWLPGMGCLLALAELLWCGRRLVVTFAVGHVGATLLVAAGLTAAVKFGWLPMSVTRATDVGMSYGTVAVLGALTAAVPRRWHPAWIGWWLAVGLAVVLAGQQFTDAGHAIALVLGMLVSTRFGEPVRWTGVRVLLLVVGGAFGYLMLANTTLSMLTATGLGVIGAVVADWIARRRRVRRALAVAALVSPRPALQG